jgi:hypothetical protein
VNPNSPLLKRSTLEGIPPVRPRKRKKRRTTGVEDESYNPDRLSRTAVVAETLKLWVGLAPKQQPLYADWWDRESVLKAVTNMLDYFMVPFRKDAPLGPYHVDIDMPRRRLAINVREGYDLPFDELLMWEWLATRHYNILTLREDIMAVKLDFTDVQNTDFEPLPDGVYEGVIYDIQEKTAQSSGKPMLEVTYKLDHSNRQVWQNLSLQPQALWKLKDWLANLGVESEKLTGAFEFEPRDLFGTRVSIKLSTRVFEGRKSNQVEEVQMAGTPIPTF